MKNSQSQHNKALTESRLTTPRAAAVAGILFALLLGAAMVLLRLSIPAASPNMNLTWLADNVWLLSVALSLVPFAGITFLWFMGVVRDQLGHLEDQFFSTVYFGSGLLFLGMIFVWAALVGAMLATHDISTKASINSDVFIFGISFMDAIVGNYALRMAGVFMFSIGMIWFRTGSMPRWLAIITFVVALGFIVAAGALRGVRFMFPAWVLLISLYILIANPRNQPNT